MGDGLENVNDRSQAGFRTNLSELKNKRQAGQWRAWVTAKEKLPSEQGGQS